MFFEMNGMKKRGGVIMKRLAVGVLAAVLVCSTVMMGCSKEGGEAKSNSAEASVSSEKVACIFGVGGLGDQSFNDLINEGLKKAKSELGVDFDYAEPSQVSDFELFLRDMASSGDYSVIISVGFDSIDALTKISAEFPDQKFGLIDSAITADNVVSYECKEEEGAFLVGALAGLLLKKPSEYGVGDQNTAGFIGAMETPIINKFYSGYAAGAGYVNNGVSVLKDYVAGDNPFGDTATAKEIAISQNNKGAGIIFHAAGGSGLGMFEAAGEYDFLAIGCNSNQNSADPEHIAASMLKRVDTAAYEIAKAACVDHDLEVGTTVTLGLADQGLDYTLEQSAVKVSEEDIAVLEQIKQKIIDKTIIVPVQEEDVEPFLASNQYKAD